MPHGLRYHEVIDGSVPVPAGGSRSLHNLPPYQFQPASLGQLLWIAVEVARQDPSPAQGAEYSSGQMKDLLILFGLDPDATNQLG